VLRAPASLCCVLALSVVAGGPPHPGHGGGKGGGRHSHSSTESQGGYTCTWASTGGGSVTCARSSGVGLRIVVSRKVVQVRTAAGVVLLSRRQPAHAHGPVRERPAGVVFSHSEDGLLCEWSSPSGGAVFCGTADRRGYTAGVLPTVATVLSSTGSIVYIGKQP
jgi:hypothetical protein